MKICFCANHQSTHVIAWAKQLSLRENFDVFLITDGDVYFDREQNPITVINLGEVTFLRILLNIYKLKRTLKSIKPDIVHAFYSTSFGLISVLAKKKNVVVTVQGSDLFIEPKRSRVFYYINKFVFKKATKIHLVADHMKNEMSKYGVKEERLFTFPEGVDTHVFRKAANPDRGRLTLIGTRRLKANYRNDILIKAASLLKQNIQRFTLTILGDGPEMENLAGLAHQSGIQDEVRFVGFVDRSDICPYLQNNKYYISTSPSDGASASLLEAMASGCFPIVTDIDANKEFISHGKTGFLFRTNDPRSLVECITRIYRNPKLFRSATKKNRLCIENRFSLEVIIERLIKEYDRIRLA